MKLHASITVPDGASELQCIFAAEHKLIGSRARYALKQGDGECIFEVEADDATALRAALNSITKVLATRERVEEVIDDG